MHNNVPKKHSVSFWFFFSIVLLFVFLSSSLDIANITVAINADTDNVIDTFDADEISGIPYTAELPNDPGPEQVNFFDDRPPRELAYAIVQAMTDDQALGQIFMLGWVGAEPSPLIMDWIRQRNLGGVKIFGWNTDDTLLLAQAVGTLQEASLEGPFNIPLLIATDQEGGWIRHVRGRTSETPGNMAIGATGYPRDAFLSGYFIGRELAALGINMNFAPTIDLYTSRNSTLIGPRSFGNDPVMAGILGSAFMKGQLAAGVIPTAKHFPGHGATHLDSHGVLPRIDICYETLWERELLPFRMLIADGVPAIMSAHVAFPQTGGGEAPASLSYRFMTDLLRNELDFDGLVITDDLMMVGATVWTRSLSLAAKEAVATGSDIIMFSSTPHLFSPVWTLLANSMRTDESFRLRVREAARRTVELKLLHLRNNERVPFVPDLEDVITNVPDPEGGPFFLNLAARSTTFIKPRHEGLPPGEPLFPLRPEDAGRVLLAGQFSNFFRSGRAAFPDALSYWYSEPRGVEGLLSYARRADTIIFSLHNAAGVRVLRHLQPLGRRVIVFSVLNPVHIDSVPWIDGAVAMYSYSPESFAAGFSAIVGRIGAVGIPP